MAETTAVATTGVTNWGQVGLNVVNNLLNAGVSIGATALMQQVNDKIKPLQQAEQKQAQQAAPVPQAVPQAAPGWQKYLPYALGGAAVLGVAYVILGKRR